MGYYDPLTGSYRDGTNPYVKASSKELPIKTSFLLARLRAVADKIRASEEARKVWDENLGKAVKEDFVARVASGEWPSSGQEGSSRYTPRIESVGEEAILRWVVPTSVLSVGKRPKAVALLSQSLRQIEADIAWLENTPEPHVTTTTEGERFQYAFPGLDSYFDAAVDS